MFLFNLRMINNFAYYIFVQPKVQFRESWHKTSIELEIGQVKQTFKHIS